MSKEFMINPRDFVKFESGLKTERSQLEEMYKSISQIYKDLSKKWFSTNLNRILSYIAGVEKEHSFVLARVNKVYLKMKENNLFIETAVREVNGGQSLTEDEEVFIRNLCKRTTYLFNKKEHSIQYPKPPERRKTESKLKRRQDSVDDVARRNARKMKTEADLMKKRGSFCDV